MPESHSIIQMNIAHYRALLKCDLCDEKRAQVKRLLAAGLAELQPVTGARQPANDHAGTRVDQITERIDRIDDELNAGPRRKRRIVTSHGEFLDDFDNSSEAGDWKARREELAMERRELTEEWERVADSEGN